nr:F-box/LRR-repeat protein At4g14103-like [Coffea arabica]
MTDYHCHHPLEPKRAFKTLDDWLSALPDDILFYILSFFRIRDAARTSVLSTRWRYLFVQLPDVDLTFSEAHKCNFMDKHPTLCYHARNKSGMLLCKSIKFINFANRVIMLRKGEFKLVLKPVIPNISVAIDSLIFAALSCKLQELDIFIGSDEIGIQSCAAIFSCRTLVTLKVANGEVDLVLPDSVYLP